MSEPGDDALEPLSDREREVLIARLAKPHDDDLIMTAEEMARMVISDGVKRHEEKRRAA